MTKTFKKLAIAGAVSTALGAGGVAFGAMDGYVGEAFLIPLVTYDISGNVVTTDTTISIYAPGEVGQDTIPNDYTAPNTTGGGNYVHPTGTAAAGTGYHWYYFTPSSVHVFDNGGTLTANDLDVIQWSFPINPAQENSRPRGEYGYMVVGTEAARDGSAADMAMVVEAVLSVTNNQGATESLRMPTYAMSDGVDGSKPRIGDECIYESAGSYPTCAPLISGIRMNNGDGSADVDVVIQMYVNRDRDGLGGHDSEDLHIVWLDRNDSGRSAVAYDAFDDHENQCSGSVDLTKELNVIHISDIDDNGKYEIDNLSSTADDGLYTLCVPTSISAGFIQYHIPEIGDTGGGVDSAGAAFAINACVDSNLADGCNLRTIANGDTLDRAPAGQGTTVYGLFGNGFDYTLRIAHDLGKQ